MDIETQLNEIVGLLNLGHYREAIVKVDEIEDLYSNAAPICFIKAYTLANLNCLRLARDYCNRCNEMQHDEESVKQLLHFIDLKLKEPLPISSIGTYSKENCISAKDVQDAEVVTPDIVKLKNIVAIRPYFIVFTHEGNIINETANSYPLEDIIGTALIYQGATEIIDKPVCLLQGIEGVEISSIINDWQAKIREFEKVGINSCYVYSEVFKEAERIFSDLGISNERYQTLTHQTDYSFNQAYIFTN